MPITLNPGPDNVAPSPSAPPSVPPSEASPAVGLTSSPPSSFFTPPELSLPPPGGAIRSLGEKYSVNAVTGTAALTIPIATTPARSAAPQIQLSYDSGAGNGVFGLGWRADVPSITRTMDKRLPRYVDDGPDADGFVLSGAEDLVPAKLLQGQQWVDDVKVRELSGRRYSVRRFVPRTEGLYTKIECWTDIASGETHWRTITADNKTALFGKDANSRIAHPNHPNAVFSWLVCATYDSTGNASIWEYKAEDSAGLESGQYPYEQNRSSLTRGVNRYLKRIKYGNRVSRLIDPDIFSPSREWLFEVVLDYGEHNLAAPLPTEDAPWSLRIDPFSTYRSGFDVRTYRLCRRVLMFHHFQDEPDVGLNCLVASTNFEFNNSASDKHTFLSSASYSGYIRSGGGYTSKSVPPSEFSYSQPIVSSEVRDVKTKNVPIGLSGNYQFLDLNGEGISGILTGDSDAWYYKPNLGEGQFEEIASLLKPSSGKQSFMDIDHDGRLEYVDFTQPFPAYALRPQDSGSPGDGTPIQDGWGPLTQFYSVPSLSWQDPNIAFVDLNGDGLPDILVTEDGLFTYYPSLGTTGFGPGSQLHISLDEEKGPRCVLADPLRTIHLADMSGDGLMDIVRIRNGDVCYWPNLGYGQFGARVVMGTPGCFDYTDSFNTERVLLADVDGSGTTDLLYVDWSGTVKIYFNKSGNEFMDELVVGTFPPASNAVTLKVVDLLGTGTGCLVWSSVSPGDSSRPFQYLDLMQEKPNLLVSVRNGRGSDTRFHYTSSTKFYLQDKAMGKPWVTRLPFPVQVVEYLEKFDYISGNRFSTRFAYHSGYYDGVEREFRGFAMVERWDTEEFSALGGTWPKAANDLDYSNTPPVLTKIWYHTGSYMDQSHLQTLLRKEYYREPGLTDEQIASMTQLPNNVVPESLFVGNEVQDYKLTTDELREAYRVMRGKELRSEVYALDGSAAEPHPYSVSESSYVVRLRQPRGNGKLQFSVFDITPQESLTLNYERQTYIADGTVLMDPRTMHSLTVEVNEFGQVLKSASVGYGRRHDEPDPRATPADRAAQRRVLATYSEKKYTNAITDQDDVQLLPKVFEETGYEIVKLRSGGSDLVRIEDIRSVITALESEQDLPYEDYDSILASENRPYRRMLKRSRQLFRKDDLTGPLPLGTVESRGIQFESYSLSATAASLNSAYVGSKFTNTELSSALLNEGYYVHGHDGADENWWSHTGRVFFTIDASATPQQELQEAVQNFFSARRFQSPFSPAGNPTLSFVDYDPYNLVVQETRDSLGNRKTAGERAIVPSEPLLRKGISYRTLRPTVLMDANRNRMASLCDELGSVIATAVMGKPEERLGDSLEGFQPPSDDAIISFIANPRTGRSAILQNATSVGLVDMWAYYRTRSNTSRQPIAEFTLSRESHVSDVIAAGELKIKCEIKYLDGFGGIIQTKTEAEDNSDGTQRWVSSGWTVLNQQGKSVRSYEPFYASTSAWEYDARAGVAATNFYDPAGRPVGILYPDHTWSKVRFTPWRIQTWDANRTVLADPKIDVDLGGHFKRLPESDFLPSWYQQRIGGGLGAAEQRAAAQSTVFADLDSISFLDSLGRKKVTLVQNAWQRSDEADKGTETLISRANLDIEGRTHVLTDVKGRIVAKYDYSMSGNLLHSASMDAGEKWFLVDIAGNALYSWNARGYRFKVAYDNVRRPVGSLLRLQNGTELQIGSTVYGDSVPNPEAVNLRGQVYENLDQAGRKRNVLFDFKGNLMRSERSLAPTYDQPFDVSASSLEPETYVGETKFDAMNRPTEAVSYQDLGANSIKTTISSTLDRSGMLKTVTAVIPGKGATPIVNDVEYSAKAQRQNIQYGCGTTTRYQYDMLTTRMTTLTSTRPDGSVVQDLRYTYNATGAIVSITDAAQQSVFFNNVRADASMNFTFDALGRLIEGTGREHVGQRGGLAPGPWDLVAGQNGRDPRDGTAMARYTERYYYDQVGNILSMKHANSDTVTPNWTRTYAYTEPSLLEPGKVNNRLSSTSVGRVVDSYSYSGPAGVEGMMTSMPHLSVLNWGYNDLVQATSKQTVNSGTPETTWYQYDSRGSRTRKITMREAAPGEQPTRKSERIYIGAFEIYREFAANGQDITLERQTVGVMDDTRRILLIENRTIGSASVGPQILLRYQLGNHLQSACIELDETSALISYEEYTPFGTSSYRTVESALETPKRYRFSSRERDDETGLYHYGARGYAPWIARWTSADPLGPGVDGTNIYAFVRNNPVMLSDLNGKQTPGGGGAPPPNYDKTAYWLFLQGNWMNGMEEVPDPSRPGERMLFGPLLTIQFGDSGDARRARTGGTRMHRLASDYALREAKAAGVEGAQDFHAELAVRKGDDVLLKSGGSPRRGAVNPDLGRTAPGQTLVTAEKLKAQGGDPNTATRLPAGSLEQTYDFKTGAGEISEEQSRLGRLPGQTVNMDYANNNPNIENHFDTLQKERPLPQPAANLPANETDFSGVLDDAEPHSAPQNAAPKPPATTAPTVPASVADEAASHQSSSGGSSTGSSGGGGSGSGVSPAPSLTSSIGTVAARALNPFVEPVEEGFNAVANWAMSKGNVGLAGTAATLARATPAVGLAMVGGVIGGNLGERLGDALGLGSTGKAILGAIGSASVGAIAAEVVLGVGATVFGAPVLVVGALVGLAAWGLSKLF